MEWNKTVLNRSDLIACIIVRGGSVWLVRVEEMTWHQYISNVHFLHSGPAGDGRAAPVARGVRM